MTFTVERGWHVATCPCGWVRAESTEGACRREAEVHQKRCKEVGGDD